MKRVLPVVCLVLALLLATLGFALLAVGLPEPGVEMHQAAAAGDESYREALEAQLQREQWQRKILVGCIFAGSLLLLVAAFLTMQPPGGRSPR